MTMQNKYVIRSRIFEKKLREIVRYFSMDLEAPKISELTGLGLSRQTINKYLKAIRGKVDPESVIHSDGWRGYNGLVDIGYKKHYRVEHGKNEFVRGKSHINGIESFWGTAKTRLSKRRGIKKDVFLLHLKECEFRFNYRNENLYDIILKILKNRPLKLS